jgi:hypothetical protein
MKTARGKLALMAALALGGAAVLLPAAPAAPADVPQRSAAPPDSRDRPPP